MKRLLLCRHAKSSWKDNTLADIDRPLNKRGRRNAPEMAGRLSQRGFVPDLVITSPARRARKTAVFLARNLGFAKKGIIMINDIYCAYPLKLLEVVNNLDNKCSRVILVGHNPEITVLANLLAGLHIENVPTCGIVAIDFDVGSWSEVKEGSGSLVFFDFPRNQEKAESD